MADVTTIAVSVGTALGIQSVYYMAVDYPYQLHKDKAKLASLKLRENINHATTSKANFDVQLAYEAFSKWNFHVSQLTLANQTAIDASHLRDVLDPELQLQLAILQAATDLDGALAYRPVVSDLIRMCESATRINKKLIEQESIYKELVQELGNLSLAEHTVSTRLEQVHFWQILRQGEIRLEMANVEADVNHTTRRFRSAIHLISVFVFLVCLHFCGLSE